MMVPVSLADVTSQVCRVAMSNVFQRNIFIQNCRHVCNLLPYQVLCAWLLWSNRYRHWNRNTSTDNALSPHYFVFSRKMVSTKFIYF